MGPISKPDIAKGVSLCELEPTTKAKFESPDPWEGIVTDKKYEDLRNMARSALE